MKTSLLNRYKFVSFCCAVVAFALVGYVSLSRLPSLPPGTSDLQTVSAVQSPPVLGPRPPPASAASIVDASIFRPSRKPFVAEMVVPPPPPPAPAAPIAPGTFEQIKLLGSVIGPTGRTALVSVVGHPAPSLIHEGDVISGWRLETIDHGKLYFSNGQTRRELLFGKRH